MANYEGSGKCLCSESLARSDPVEKKSRSADMLALQFPRLHCQHISKARLHSKDITGYL